MSEIELKPCPFCGSKAKLMRVGAGRIVKCEGCGVSTSFLADDAAQAWNARAIDRDELWEVVESLEKPWPVDKGKHDTIPREDVQLFEREMASRIRKAVGE